MTDHHIHMHTTVITYIGRVRSEGCSLAVCFLYITGSWCKQHFTSYYCHALIIVACTPMSECGSEAMELAGLLKDDVDIVTTLPTSKSNHKPLNMG
jgi:hypothetical protein